MTSGFSVKPTSDLFNDLKGIGRSGESLRALIGGESRPDLWKSESADMGSNGKRDSPAHESHFQDFVQSELGLKKSGLFPFSWCVRAE